MFEVDGATGVTIAGTRLSALARQAEMTTALEAAVNVRG